MTSLRSATFTLALALAVAGCAQDITVTVRAGDRPPDPDVETSALAASGAFVNGLALDRVRLVLRNIRLQATPTPDGSPGEGDRAVSPALVMVDLSGDQLAPGAMTEIVGRRHLSWDSFYQSIIELRPVTPGELGDPSMDGWTIVVNGRAAGGAPFTYRSNLGATAPLVLVRPSVFRGGLNHNNLTVNLAPNRWFEGPGGAPLDPFDPASAASIDANIVHSIDTYMDDNRDGNPDFLG